MPYLSPDVIRNVAIAGTIFLWIWYLMHIRSRMRGFVLAVIGSVVVLSIGFGWNAVVRILGMLSVMVLPAAIVFLTLFLLTFLLIALWSRRRAAVADAEYESQSFGTCPGCGQRGPLYEYEVPLGRGYQIVQMCGDCGGPLELDDVDAGER